MGLLDKLWDDVLAGPQPDNGLRRLRHKTKLPADMMVSEEAKQMAERRKSGDFLLQQKEARRVTQSITIARPPPLRVDFLDMDSPGSTPSTPGTSSTPTFSSSMGSPSIFDRERYTPRGISTPLSPALDSPGARNKENVWTNVHPGSNKEMRKIRSEKFDKQAPSSPTVYDWVVLSALDR